MLAETVRLSVGKMETILYFIRHAQSHPTSRLPDAHWPLSRQGHTQAEELSRLLSTLGIQRLFSSPFVRCRDTIRPFAEQMGLDCIVKDEFREQTIAQELRSDFAEVWSRSWTDFGFALPGCESSMDAQSRFVAAVMEVLTEHQKQTIGICTHGNVIGLFLNHVDKTLGKDEAQRMRNPDVLKFSVQEQVVAWHRDFYVPGLEQLSTPYKDTPIEGL